MPDVNVDQTKNGKVFFLKKMSLNRNQTCIVFFNQKKTLLNQVWLTNLVTESHHDKTNSHTQSLFINDKAI